MEMCTTLWKMGSLFRSLSCHQHPTYQKNTRFRPFGHTFVVKVKIMCGKPKKIMVCIVVGNHPDISDQKKAPVVKI